ncbi:MAG: hypothetical protein LLF94_04260 [Chlamydiales bacterium]|nr:hypothetical protein [Chlamydiales bacterium]
MYINEQDRQVFNANPDKYVLRLGKDRQVHVEKRGLWTWIKRNLLYPSQYKLKEIARGLENANLDDTTVNNVNQKINKYNQKNSSQIHTILTIAQKAGIAAHTKSIDDESKVARIASSTKDKSKTPKELIFLKAAVVEHLTPYLEGKITPQTEDTKRTSLPELIMEKLQKEFPGQTFSLEDVKNNALQEYIRVAAWKGALANSGLFQHGSRTMRMFAEPEVIIAAILPAVEHGFAIDFKGHEANVDLKKQLTDAVTEYVSQYYNSQKPKSSAGDDKRVAQAEQLKAQMAKDKNDLFLQ